MQLDDGVGEDTITQWAIVGSVRMVRAVVFTVVAVALLLVIPYQMEGNVIAVITALAVGILSLINQGSRISLVAIGVLLLLAIVPKEVVLGLIN